jgi:hypothetical protein
VPVLAVVLGLTAACGHLGERNRVNAAVRAVLEELDPKHAAVVLATKPEIARVRGIVGSTRRVALADQFAKEHPEEPVPYNISFVSARAEGQVVFVRLHLQAVSHPPPQTLFCGSSILYEVTYVGQRFVIRPIEETVC